MSPLLGLALIALLIAAWAIVLAVRVAGEVNRLASALIISNQTRANQISELRDRMDLERVNVEAMHRASRRVENRKRDITLQSQAERMRYWP